METPGSRGSNTFSRQIERRLKETNRAEQAAAFVRLAYLRRLLDMLIKQFDPSELDVSEVGRLLRDRRARRARTVVSGRSEVSSAFLTPLGSGHQALVADFEDIVANIGELSMALEGKRGERDLSDTLRDLLKLCAEAPEHAVSKVPVAGSLDDLEPVGELSEAYAHPDFSDKRPRSNPFLRK
jgi:hypothetical protein